MCQRDNNLTIEQTTEGHQQVFNVARNSRIGRRVSTGSETNIYTSTLHLILVNIFVGVSSNYCSIDVFMACNRRRTSSSCNKVKNHTSFLQWKKSCLLLCADGICNANNKSLGWFCKYIKFIYIKK